MNNSHIFISHASKDDDFVKQLRVALESHQLPVWVDSRNLRGGAKLEAEIAQAIEMARQTIVVLSPNTINSPWVRKEIQQALAVEKQRGKDGYRVIPLLLPGVEPSALALWFGEEPVGVKVELKIGSVSEALPQILAALGEEAPDDLQPAAQPVARPVAELKLKLKSPRIEEVETGKRRGAALAQLFYDPPDPASPEAESREFKFIAPLGVIEADHLHWYLEEYYRWPVGIFTERARFIESQLPQWGKELYQAATVAQSAQALLADWQRAGDDVERRFSIFVDSRVPEGSSEDEQRAANEAASALLALPWELLHDEHAYLFHGDNPVRVRRCLPKERSERPAPTALPIRILLVSPRPEDDRAAYIDHRISARPLVEAVENLGQLVELTLLSPPTFQALQEALRQAKQAGKPFDVIHFDGHGVFDREHGLGALCFEDAKDAHKVEHRASELVYAIQPKEPEQGGSKHLAELIHNYRVPLVFLEACQTARSEELPAASVAAKLLEEGVTSVVAMTHSVLVETARRFVEAFYRSLAAGHRVGTAMLEGQRALYANTWRGRVMGAGDLRLQDWFVPVLYQEQHDPQLITRLLPERVRQLQADQRRLSLGALPEPPAHSFVGRSRELLRLERMLANAEQRYAVVRGRGGEGKTTLAVELARWLAQTRRFDRAAFVSLEEYTDARGVLDALGRQLLPEGENWSVAQFSDLKEARLEVERALRDRRTIIVLDNLESVLAGYGTGSVSDLGLPETPNAEAQVAHAPRTASAADDIFALCQDLLDADPATRLVFTSREPLPEPFAHRHRAAELRELDRHDAIELVSQVMKREGLKPKHDDAGNTPKEVEDLVEAVGCHARALTLLAREIAIRGVSATTGNVRRLMVELDRRHPGDRENSLYASVELSLRRLPPAMQQQIKALGVFHGGANIGVLAMMLEEPETVADFARQLIEVGLAEDAGYGHLHLDPALPAFLLRGLDEDEQKAMRSRWAQAMQELAAFLYQQIGEDMQVAASLTRLELHNLLAMLLWAKRWESPERVVSLAGQLETLLAHLGRPRALAQASEVREHAARGLVEWSHARFLTEAVSIDRLLERGQLPPALATARQLLERCQAAGNTIYLEAAYDLAAAHISLGRVLGLIGEAEAALKELAEAQRRFEVLAATGNRSAERMAAVALAERGYCLRNLGRFDEAAAIYQEAIKRAEKRNDKREVAGNTQQLGTVRMYQKRYDDALKAHDKAKTIFEILGEPRSIAAAWHQIAMVYREAGQLEQAERPYRQSLAISVQQNNPAREADTLNDLGNLYEAMGRLDEAVTVYRQAVELYARLQDHIKEGFACSNLANTFVKLQRYDEARAELRRAIECKEPFGHAAEPWKTWNILHNLERATGHAAEAAEAREKAIRNYLAYRRNGGVSQSPHARIYALVAQAIHNRQTSEAEESLAQLASRFPERWQQVLIGGLHAILRSDRNLALTRDPDLPYRDAVELRLLLEALGVK